MVIQLIRQIIKRYQKIKSEIITDCAIQIFIADNKKESMIFRLCIIFL